MTTKRRANNDGTLYHNEKKGLWQAMLSTPAGNRLTKAGKDKAIVLDWLNEQRLLVGRGRHIEPHSVTLGEWIGEWFETYAKIRVKPRTYDRYVSLLKHLEPLYHARLSKLAPHDVQKIYNGMAASYSAQTILHIKNCLSGCLRQAIENGLVTDNIASKTHAPKRIKKQIEIFTPEEIKSLLDAAEGHRNALIIPLAYLTGLKLSEVLALRCEDIAGNALTVNQTIRNHRRILFRRKIKFLAPNNPFAGNDTGENKPAQTKIRHTRRAFVQDEQRDAGNPKKLPVQDIQENPAGSRDKQNIPHPAAHPRNGTHRAGHTNPRCIKAARTLQNQRNA
jgi:hypothetical protein